MSDGRRRALRSGGSSDRDKHSSRESNTREEPNSRSPLTTGCQPVRLREHPYLVLLVAGPKRFRRGSVAASSRRQGQRDTYDMQARSRRQYAAGGAFGSRFGRFGFSTRSRPNSKTPHGSGFLVDLVDLVDLFRGGVCGARSAALDRARARPLPFLPPERTDQIDQIDQMSAPYGGLNLVDRDTADQITDQTGVAA